MENIHNKIKAYLGRTPDFFEEIIIEDERKDGVSNPYISKWNAKDKVKPTDAQLNALSSQATTLENNAIAVANRQKEYGSIAEQLEYIVEHGVSSFIEKQNEIKTKYPKESE